MSRLPTKKLEHWNEAMKAFNTLQQHGIPLYIVPKPDNVRDVDYDGEYIERVLGYPDYFQRPYLYVVLRVDPDGYFLADTKEIYVYHDGLFRDVGIQFVGRKIKPDNGHSARKKLVKDVLGRYSWFQWKGTKTSAMIIRL